MIILRKRHYKKGYYIKRHSLNLQLFFSNILNILMVFFMVFFIVAFLRWHLLRMAIFTTAIFETHPHTASIDIGDFSFYNMTRASSRTLRTTLLLCNSGSQQKWRVKYGLKRWVWGGGRYWICSVRWLSYFFKTF